MNRRKQATFTVQDTFERTKKKLDLISRGDGEYSQAGIDPSKDKRTEAQFCRHCFYKHKDPYLRPIETSQPCAACGTGQYFPDTETGILCQPCATKHDLCMHCGADINLDVERRKKEYFAWYEADTLDAEMYKKKDATYLARKIEAHDEQMARIVDYLEKHPDEFDKLNKKARAEQGTHSKF